MSQQTGGIEIRLPSARQPLYEILDRQVLTEYQDRAEDEQQGAMCS